MRQLVKAIAAGGFCTALCIATPASASTSTWRVQTAPVPSNSKVTSLAGVSCPSRGICTAVGFSNQRAIHTRGETLAERWEGGRWAIQGTPNTPGEDILSAVSCPATSACAGVGIAAGQDPLAEHWDGTNWTIRHMPFPAGSSNAQPGAVSCTSPASCTAVGLYYMSQQDQTLPLAERWDGTNWAVQPVPLPAGAFEAILNGVSCPTATDCTAVGDYNVSTTGGVPFAEQWNGSTWTAPGNAFPARRLPGRGVVPIGPFAHRRRERRAPG
jgi:hypothetical protein